MENLNEYPVDTDETHTELYNHDKTVAEDKLLRLCEVIVRLLENLLTHRHISATLCAQSHR